MPDIFNDPEVKAAMAAAGVVHRPGLAQEVLRDLAPFLAEEGIDLNDPGDAGPDDINAALAPGDGALQREPSVHPLPEGEPKEPVPSSRRTEALAV